MSHLPPLLFLPSQLLLWVHPFAMDKKLHDAASAWTLCPQASPGGIHLCTLGYESSSAGLSWFVHEGTWWLGQGRESEVSPNGKSPANPCKLPADWQVQREALLSVAGTAQGAPGPLLHGKRCPWRRYSSNVSACGPLHLLKPDS